MLVLNTVIPDNNLHDIRGIDKYTMLKIAVQETSYKVRINISANLLTTCNQEKSSFSITS
jgi:hypothetical protein